MKMEDEIRATAKKLRVDPGIENVAEWKLKLCCCQGAFVVLFVPLDG
jgi:hypothetical protein